MSAIRGSCFRSMGQETFLLKGREETSTTICAKPSDEGTSQRRPGNNKKESATEEASSQTRIFPKKPVRVPSQFGRYMCYKCKDKEAVVNVREKACRACFISAVEDSFSSEMRSAVGTYLPSKVLLGFSGDLNSWSLLDLIHQATSRTNLNNSFFGVKRASLSTNHSASASTDGLYANTTNFDLYTPLQSQDAKLNCACNENSAIKLENQRRELLSLQDDKAHAPSMCACISIAKTTQLRTSENDYEASNFDVQRNSQRVYSTTGNKKHPLDSGQQDAVERLVHTVNTADFDCSLGFQTTIESLSGTTDKPSCDACSSGSAAYASSSNNGKKGENTSLGSLSPQYFVAYVNFAEFFSHYSASLVYNHAKISDCRHIVEKRFGWEFHEILPNSLIDEVNNPNWSGYIAANGEDKEANCKVRYSDGAAHESNFSKYGNTFPDYSRGGGSDVEFGLKNTLHKPLEKKLADVISEDKDFSGSKSNSSVNVPKHRNSLYTQDRQNISLFSYTLAALLKELCEKDEQTAKEFFSLLRMSLLWRHARIMGCQLILLSSSTDDIARKLLRMTCLGGGINMPLITSPAGDDRFPGLKLFKPLRTLYAKEVALFHHYRRLPPGIKNFFFFEDLKFSPPLKISQLPDVAQLKSCHLPRRFFHLEPNAPSAYFPMSAYTPGLPTHSLKCILYNGNDTICESVGDMSSKEDSTIAMRSSIVRSQVSHRANPSRKLNSAHSSNIVDAFVRQLSASSPPTLMNINRTCEKLSPSCISVNKRDDETPLSGDYEKCALCFGLRDSRDANPLLFGIPQEKLKTAENDTQELKKNMCLSCFTLATSSEVAYHLAEILFNCNSIFLREP